MRKHRGGVVLALDSQTLSITATCIQYHDYGRSPGLKIRSSQEGLGSTPTFVISNSGEPHPAWSSDGHDRNHSRLDVEALRPCFSSYTSVIETPLNSVLGRSHWPPGETKPGGRHGVAQTQATTEIGMVSPERRNARLTRSGHAPAPSRRGEPATLSRQAPAKTRPSPRGALSQAASRPPERMRRSIAPIDQIVGV